MTPPTLASSDRRAPVAVFVYNRPEHAQRLFRSLAANPAAGDRDVVVYSDGPRRPSDAPSVRAVREGLAEWIRPFRARVVERESNQGLARSIVGGVTELCASYGEVIVLEDDLILSPDFLSFMDAALEHYREAESVMQVSACTLATPAGLRSDSFLLPVTSTWGWATWRRAWGHFSWDPVGWPAVRADAAWLDRFTLGGAADYVGMLEDRLAGRNDSWGILWWYAVSRLSGQAIYPRESLVLNGGFDGSGTHCGGVVGVKEPVACDGRFARDPSRALFPVGFSHRPEHLHALTEHLAGGPLSGGSLGWSLGIGGRWLKAARRVLLRALAR